MITGSASSPTRPNACLMFGSADPVTPEVRGHPAGAGGGAPASEGDPPIRAQFVEARCVRVSQRIVSRSAPRSLFKSSVPLPRLVGPRSSARPMPPPDR